MRRWSALQCWQRGLLPMSIVARRQQSAVQRWAEMVLAKEQHCYLLAEHAAVLSDLVVAAEQTTVLADLALADVLQCQKAVKHSVALAAKAFADEKDANICAQDATASAVLALAEDKQHQEDAATQQSRAEDERVMAPVMPPDPMRQFNAFRQNVLYALLLLMQSWPRLHVMTLRMTAQLRRQQPYHLQWLRCPPPPALRLMWAQY
jgi:hypothetical protein